MLRQEYQEQARESRRAARAEAQQAAEQGNHIDPLSAVAQRRLKQDMPHELQGHVRPGVVSHFPHNLQEYQTAVEVIQVCFLPTATALAILVSTSYAADRRGTCYRQSAKRLAG